MVSNIAVDRPRTAEELAATLREAASAGKAVTPVGGGRATSMGGPLQRCDVELYTTHLDRVIEHSQADMVVTAEAGITLEALQETLGKSGQFLPLDPFNSPGHTLGGLLATGWTGPLRLRYGSPRDYLIGIRVALPDGKLASAGGRVVKNVSGYDLMKLHYGALGTLGVIVAASLRVFPKPLRDLTVTSRGGWDDAQRALELALAPSALELFDDGRVVARFQGSPDALNRVTQDLGWQAESPDFWVAHSRRAPVARITVPPGQLRGIVDGLSDWWASPGAGVAYFSPGGADSAATARGKVEAAGGRLVLLAATHELSLAIDAWGTPPATLDVMRRLKDAFDPHHVLNPGRFVV